MDQLVSFALARLFGNEPRSSTHHNVQSVNCKGNNKICGLKHFDISIVNILCFTTLNISPTSLTTYSFFSLHITSTIYSYKFGGTFDREYDGEYRQLIHFVDGRVHVYINGSVTSRHCQLIKCQIIRSWSCSLTHNLVKQPCFEWTLISYLFLEATFVQWIKHMVQEKRMSIKQVWTRSNHNHQGQSKLK